MESNTEILLGVITLLFGIVVYFTKKIFDNTESKSTDVSEMKPKLEILWQDKFAPAHFTRQLNDRGKDILENSGIKEIINEKKQQLLELVKFRKSKNPYDAEIAIFEVVKQLKSHCPGIVDKLKDGAFKTGSNIDSVLFVGGIYLRNEIFPDLGFSLNDLDNSKN